MRYKLSLNICKMEAFGRITLKAVTPVFIRSRSPRSASVFVAGSRNKNLNSIKYCKYEVLQSIFCVAGRRNCLLLALLAGAKSD